MGAQQDTAVNNPAGGQERVSLAIILSNLSVVCGFWSTEVGFPKKACAGAGVIDVKVLWRD